MAIPRLPRFDEGTPYLEDFQDWVEYCRSITVLNSPGVLVNRSPGGTTVTVQPLALLWVRFGAVTAYDDTTGTLGTGTADVLTDYDDSSVIKNQDGSLEIDVLNKYPNAIASGSCGYVIPGLGGYHVLTVGCDTIAMPPGP